MSSSVMNRMSMISRPCKWKSGTLYGQVPENSFADLACVRAGTKWVMNSAGVLVQRAANEPAVDYRGSTPAFNGLLIERANTNLDTQSRVVTAASLWGVSGGASLNEAAGTNFDGASDATRLNLTGASSFAQKSYNLTAGVTYAATFWVRNDTHTAGQTFRIQFFSALTLAQRCDLTFNFSTGVVTTNDSGANATPNLAAFATPLGGGWFRLELIFQVLTTGSVQIRLIGNTGVTASLWVGLHVLEVGRRGGSYINTTGSTASRVADAYSKTGLSAYFNNTSREGTIYLALRRDLQLNAAELLSITQASGSTTNRLLLATTADDRIRAVVTNGGVDQADIQSGTNQSGVLHVAFAYKDNDCQLYVNGASVGTDTGVTIPSNLAELFLGGVSAANNANYWMKLFAYAPERLTTAQIASLYTQLQNVA